jgi:hypothetical protein
VIELSRGGSAGLVEAGVANDVLLLLLLLFLSLLLLLLLLISMFCWLERNNVSLLLLKDSIGGEV